MWCNLDLVLKQSRTHLFFLKEVFFWQKKNDSNKKKKMTQKEKNAKKKRLFDLKGVNGDDWSRIGNCRDLGVNGMRKWQWCANITEFWRGKFNSR
jgi:hypothetical protein